MTEQQQKVTTARQLEILRHSLGLSVHGREYRNYFVAGGKDIQTCRELVALGLMVEYLPNQDRVGQLFHVTDEGKQVAREVAE